MPELKRNQTINYDDPSKQDNKNLLDKVFDLTGINFKNFGNLFRGEGSPSNRDNEALKSDRGYYNSRAQPCKPPLHSEKRQSQQFERVNFQRHLLN